MTEEIKKGIGESIDILRHHALDRQDARNILMPKTDELTAPFSLVVAKHRSICSGLCGRLSQIWTDARFSMLGLGRLCLRHLLLHGSGFAMNRHPPPHTPATGLTDKPKHSAPDAWSGCPAA